MKRYIILLLLLVPAFIYASELNVIRESNDALSLEFRLPSYNLAQKQVNGLQYHYIESDAGYFTGEEGYPQLKSFSYAIAIPHDGNASARIVSQKSSTQKSIDIYPVPSMYLEGEEPIYETRKDNAAYSKNQLYPSSIVEISEPAYVGDRRFVSLRIFPFQYNAAQKELLVHNELQISVSISGSKQATENWQLGYSPIDSSADSFFINNSSSQKWRLPRKKNPQYESPKNADDTISEIQIVVDSEGIYKVSYQLLKSFITEMTDSLQMDLSWDPDQVDPRFLELRDEYGQIPIHFYGEEDGSFDPQDYFEFFGDKHYGDISHSDDYTAENVYTLSLKDGYGARMVVENGGLTNSNPMQFTLADAYEETVFFEKQLISDKLGRAWSTQNPEYYREDVWFWEKITAPDLEIIPLELQHPIDSRIRKANVKFTLHGLTYLEDLPVGEYDHEATIRLNQAMVNTHSWRGQTEKIFLNQEGIANSFLRHGTNNAYISLSGNTASGNKEQVLLDNIEISYWRQYRTDEDFIKFSKPNDRPNGLFQFDVQGFSSPDVSVYKIGSSIFSSMQIEPFTVDGGAPYTVSLQDSVSSQAIRYYAVEESAKKEPKSLRLNIPSDLKNPQNSANVIMISPYQFLQAEGTQMLVDLWESEGHSVKLVDLQDVYDEFNSGIVSAESIKDFLSYAYEYWSGPRLSHVVLLGEGIADSRDNSPSRKYNLIPVKKTWTYKHGATASDTWYACLVGTDTVPDISIARLNVWEEEQILNYAVKALEYRTNLQTARLWNNHITLTAGGKIDDDGDIFAQQSERIRDISIPSHYRVTRVYTNTQTVSPEYFGGTFNLKDAINSGTQFVQFMGHGGGRVWADYNLFNFNDVATLNNSVYPVFLSLACYASAFDTNGASSISEALVTQPGKGAIATLGFSGLGYLHQDEGWGVAFNEAVFEHDFATLGEAYIFALARFYTTTSGPDARYALTNGSVYLGDPLIRFSKPDPNLEVTLSELNPQPGATLQISSQFPASVNSARIYVMNNNETIQNVPYDLNVDDGEFTANYNIPEGEQNYMRTVMVAGYSDSKTYVGQANFGVGRPALAHEHYIPELPAYSDSTAFAARVFSPKPVIDMYVSVRTDSSYTQQNGWSIVWEDYPMAPDPEDSTLWISVEKFRKMPTSRVFPFKYYMTDADSTEYESPEYKLQIAGPDLFLRDIVFDPNEGNPKLLIKSTNVGNTASIETDLRLYIKSGTQTILHSTQDFAPLEVDEFRWDEISLEDVPNGDLVLEARVNSSHAFSEWELYVNTNNYISIQVPMNYFVVDAAGATLTSLGNNLTCDVPMGFVDSGTLGIAVNTLPEIALLNQPDVRPILMQYAELDSIPEMSVPFELDILDSSMVDSLGFFVSGKRVNLSFKYNAADEETQAYESDNTYKIYRYNSEYQKWVLVGGHVSIENNTVSFEVSREGIYSIFRNLDTKQPIVDANVQDQEFTVGGYVAGDGVISLLLSDANGIDVIDNSIRLFLNGTEVIETDYVISINKENINQVPIKYQLNLSKGNHELKVDCRDLNGNFMTRELQFIVNDTFDVKNLANYPNPVMGQAQDPKNDGRTRFTYVLTDSADEVYIKVYTISGRLVKTFRNMPTGVGYHEYPRTVYAWDCKDEQGYPLANGTYFYRFVARKGGKKIEKTMKMAILK